MASGGPRIPPDQTAHGGIVSRLFYDCLYLPEEYRAMVTPTRISLTSPQLEEAIDELATIVNELMDIHEKKFIAHAHLLEMLDQAILAEYHGCTLLKIPAKLL